MHSLKGSASCGELVKNGLCGAAHPLARLAVSLQDNPCNAVLDASGTISKCCCLGKEIA